jgi:hypothetical protein
MRFSPCAFLVFLGFSASVTSAQAEDFCAVTLNVVGADRMPISSTWIELDDPAGNVVRKEIMMGPTLQICDFGFGPHTLRVGTNECLPVTISNLRVVVGSPVELNVMLNLCGYREIMRNACLLYFRVVDEGGHSIPDVGFSPRIAAERQPKTDSYGRYQILFRGKQDITFAKQGFSPRTVSVQCDGVEEIDKSVVMRKATENP